MFLMVGLILQALVGCEVCVGGHKRRRGPGKPFPPPQHCCFCFVFMFFFLKANVSFNKYNGVSMRRKRSTAFLLVCCLCILIVDGYEGGVYCPSSEPFNSIFSLACERGTSEWEKLAESSPPAAFQQ